MTNTPDDLAAEFPEDVEIVHHLKTTKGHFAALADRYQEVNCAILRIESKIDAVSDWTSERLKKERLLLLDRIGAILREARRQPA
jgi:Uncharacterized protein conserved in bacteria